LENKAPGHPRIDKKKIKDVDICFFVYELMLTPCDKLFYLLVPKKIYIFIRFIL